MLLGNRISPQYFSFVSIDWTVLLLQVFFLVFVETLFFVQFSCNLGIAVSHKVAAIYLLDRLGLLGNDFVLAVCEFSEAIQSFQHR